MPFGLNGAAVTFQRLIDWVLVPHWEYVGAYIDDMVVYMERLGPTSGSGESSAVGVEADRFDSQPQEACTGAT